MDILKQSLLPIGLIICLNLCAHGQEVENQYSIDVTLPVQFVQNAGQWNRLVQYRTMNGASSMLCMSDGVLFPYIPSSDPRLQIPGEQPTGETEALQVRFVSPSSKMKIIPTNKLATQSHFYRSSTPERWYEHVPNFKRIVYENIWDGVDIAYYEKNGKLRQDFIVQDIHSLRRIKLQLGSNDGSSFKITQNSAIATQMSIKRSDQGVVSFVSTDSLPEGGLILSTEFFFSFGGTGFENGTIVNVDSDGNLYACGMTKSMDFPLKNSWLPPLTSMDSSAAVAVRLSCDGKTLLYSTELIQKYAENTSCLAKIHGRKQYFLSNIHDSCWVVPITSNAIRDTIQRRHIPCDILCDIYLAVLAEDGSVEYGSYIGEPGERKPVNSLEVDESGNVYVGGDIEACGIGMSEAVIDTTYRIWGRNVGFTPYDSLVCRVARSEYMHKSFMLKLPPSLDKYTYGTYIANSDDGVSTEIEVDSKGFIVFLMPTQKVKETFIDRDFVSPISTAHLSYHDYYLIKIDPRDSRVILGTYLGVEGLEMEVRGSKGLAIDKNDNIIICGVITGNDLPLHEPMQSVNNGKRDICFLKLSPEGKIVKSTYLGSANVESTGGFRIDRFGNLVVLCSSTQIDTVNPFPETHRIRDFARYHTKQERMYITIIDSAWSKILYSCSYMQGTARSNHIYGNQLQVDDYGYVYTESIYPEVPDVNIAAEYYKLWNPILPANMTGWHIMKLRPTIYSWALPKWDVALSKDTLMYSSARNLVAPDVVSVTATLTNIAPVNSAEKMTARMILPQGVELDPPTQSLNIDVANVVLAPNQSVSKSWTVRVKPSIPMPDSLTLNFYCEYDWKENETDCPIPNSQGAKSIVISKKPREYNVRCSIDAIDTLTVTGTDYAEQPLSLKCEVENNDEDPVQLGYIELTQPWASASSTVPENDWKKQGVVLQPGERHTFEWLLNIHERDMNRDLQYVVNIYDTLWFQITNCQAVITAPKVPVVQCTTSGPENIFYNVNTGYASKDTFTVTLLLHNTSDTLSRITEARVLPSNSGKVKMVSTQSPVRTTSIAKNGASALSWSMYLQKPIYESKVDTIEFQYMTENDSSVRYCLLFINISTLSADAHCTITSPAVLTVLDYSYDPNPFNLDYTLQNKGSAQLDVASVAITLPPDITTTDPLTVAVTPLAPNGKHDIQWNLKALTSAFERNISIPVTAYDSENKPVAVCEHHLLLPAITDMTCESQSTAHIVYNANDRRYDPNPVTASLVVYNHVDTVQTTIEAEIDLTTAPHLKLATGETNPQTIVTLTANVSHQFDWKLDVLPADSQVTETVSMRYRSAGHQEWRECSWIYTIDEKAKTYSATCIAGGVDSLWLNGTAELIIPNPFQVYYTITNTGTGMLTNCNGTIHLPNHLQLMTGEQPKKYYGNIEPGSSVQRSWMVGADPSVQSLGTHDITFSFKADNLTTDVPCDHTVMISQRDQIDLALSHKNLYFIAKKDAALPASQQIMVYSGSPASMPWTAQGYPSWLNVQPSNGNTQSVDIQPNTTAMNYGTYTGNVDFASSAPNSPKTLNVIYDIVETLGLPEVPAINGVTLYQNYPNPFSESTSISFNVESRMQVMLSVYNILGDLISTQSVAAQPGMNTVTVSNLQPGLYMYVLATPNGAVSRRLVRR